MKGIIVSISLFILGGCYSSISPGEDGEPNDLRLDDPSTTDPIVEPPVDPSSDPWYDPSVDPWYDPIVDPAVDPSYDPWVDPYPDPIYDPWTDTYPCPPGLTLCGGVCVDTMSDPYNCGSCGNICPWGSSSPDLNFEGCMNPGLGIYTLCCVGSCRPVSNMSCGDCRARCDAGSSCTGLWDAAAGICTMFACMGIFTGSTGSSCTTADDCLLVPSPERTCLWDFSGIPLPGGYCTAYCRSAADCGPGGECVDLLVDRLCLQLCDSDAACRIDESYSCNPLPFDPSGATYCIPPIVF